MPVSYVEQKCVDLMFLARLAQLCIIPLVKSESSVWWLVVLFTADKNDNLTELHGGFEVV
jgi:hypothetical protein